MGDRHPGDRVAPGNAGLVRAFPCRRGSVVAAEELWLRHCSKPAGSGGGIALGAATVPFLLIHHGPSNGNHWHHCLPGDHQPVLSQSFQSSPMPILVTV